MTIGKLLTFLGLRVPMWKMGLVPASRVVGLSGILIIANTEHLLWALHIDFLIDHPLKQGY